MNDALKDLGEVLLVLALLIAAIGWPLFLTAALIKYVFGL